MDLKELNEKTLNYISDTISELNPSSLSRKDLEHLLKVFLLNRLNDLVIEMIDLNSTDIQKGFIRKFYESGNLEGYVNYVNTYFDVRVAFAMACSTFDDRMKLTMMTFNNSK